jgi:hypothetical protein
MTDLMPIWVAQRIYDEFIDTIWIKINNLIISGYLLNFGLEKTWDIAITLKQETCDMKLISKVGVAFKRERSMEDIKFN